VLRQVRAERFARRLTLTESHLFSLACCRRVPSPQATGAVVSRSTSTPARARSWPRRRGCAVPVRRASRVLRCRRCCWSGSATWVSVSQSRVISPTTRWLYVLVPLRLIATWCPAHHAVGRVVAGGIPRTSRLVCG
jgi:hypothetical protein